MSSEVTQQSTSLIGSAATSVAMSGVMTGGFGSLSSARRFGINGAIKTAKLNNETLRAFADKHKDVDFFTRGYATARNYEELARAKKNFAKLKKITEKDSGITFFQKIKKVFTKKDYKAINEANFKEADVLLNGAKDKTGKILSEGLETKLKRGVDIAEVTSKSLGKNLGSLFKSELKDPFGIFFAGTEVVTRFASQAIPAFKNDGFIAGMKETGKALAAGAATFVTDAGFSVAFRTVGAAVGSIIGPLGAAVGSIVGNAIGGMLSCNLINKIFPMKEEQANGQEVAQSTNEIVQAQGFTQSSPTQAQVAAAMPKNQNGNQLNFSSDNLTPEQVQKLAYSQAFPKNAAKINGFYA